jgi:LuxR family maltose regulon positive regulatory protein
LAYIPLTKTIPPAVGKLTVPRNRLLGLCDRAAERRLVLIKAPAGYGKTTAAAEWCKRLSEQGAVVAWLSLDAEDDEPTEFAHQLTRAIENASAELGQEAAELLRSSSLVPARNVLSAIVNAVSESDREIYLVLDDLHLISDRRCHDLIMYLLRYAPSNLHIIITSRMEPPLALSKLRLDDHVVEIDASLLQFDLEEARDFLGADLAGKLKAGGVAKLYSATEGWPAALQLARISLRNAPDPVAHVLALSGTTPNISQYLEDTLSILPKEVVQFLLRTSVLDQMNSELCEAVTGMPNGSAMLQALEREQFLLILLDEAEGWYRYHNLMREFLLGRLRARMGEEVAELNRRAYRWYEERDLWREAVHYAIAAGDYHRALEFIENCAMSLVVTGDLFTLLNWERHLPAELMSGQLEVKLALAWGMVLVTRFKEGDQLLTQVEKATEGGEHSDLWWRCRALRAVLYALRDDSAHGAKLAIDCLHGHSFDPFNFIALCNVTRYAHLRTGNWAAFYGVPTPEFPAGETSYVLAENYRLCLQGIAAAKQLKFDEALEYYAAARDLAEKYVGPKSVSAQMVTGLVAQVRYEQGAAHDAELSVLDSLDLIETTAFHEAFFQAFLTLARAAAGRGDLQRALVLLNRAERLGWDRGWGRLVAALLVERTRILLAGGNLSEAVSLLQVFEGLKAKHPAPKPCSWAEIHIHALISQGLIAGATGHNEDAVAFLEKAYNMLLSIGDRVTAMRVGADLALACWRLGATEKAFATLEQVVAWAAKVNSATFMTEHGDEMGRLLLSAEEKGLFSGDVQRFVSELLEKHYDRKETQSERPAVRERQVLTNREGSIITFIAEGRSNKEIARELGVTPETIKSHVKRIFQKLSAETRAQAVVRAQYLGILGLGGHAASNGQSGAGKPALPTH